MAPLAEALKTNASLQTLWLDGNQITDVASPLYSEMHSRGGMVMHINMFLHYRKVPPLLCI